MNPIAVYVHIPFCVLKCGYCDFNAYAGLDHLKPAYADAVVREAGIWADVLAGRTVTSIGFGGGTPGEVPAEHIAAIVEAVAAYGSLASDAEVTLEANPGTTDDSRMRGLRVAGVNRISLGAQSFESDELRFLDRIHSPEAIAAAVGLARDAGFRSIGLDLIYGIPGQTMANWERSVRRAVSLGVDHISAYALTVEEETPLGLRVARGRATMPEADFVADMYDHASAVLEGAGFEQYELSNWAKPGHRSRHNQVYWQDGEFIGLGAGAHGYLGGRRYENIAHPRRYIDTLREGSAERPAVGCWHELPPATAMADWVSLRLRHMDGFHEDEFLSRFGRSLRPLAAEALDAGLDAGVLECEGGAWRISRSGRLLHGEVTARIAVAIDGALAGATTAR